MRVIDIVRRVRTSVGDSTAYQFDNSTLNDWINDAIREAVVENGLLQKRATSTLVAGTDDYSLPTDIFKLYSIYVDNQKIPVFTQQQWEERHAFVDQSQNTGFPSECYVFAGQLTLFPIPDSANTLQINYLYMPTEIAFTGSPTGDSTWQNTVPGIPEVYHMRIVAYCIAQVALMDDDMNKHISFMDQFKSGVIDLKAKQDTEDDLYPFMSVSGRDSGDDYGQYLN